MWKQHIIGMKTELRHLYQADIKCPIKISVFSLNIKDRMWLSVEQQWMIVSLLSTGIKNGWKAK